MQKSLIALILAAAASLSAQQPSPLRVVVLEGENAVNIIQQRTAVHAVVEVRDRNNLPVSGATVTFVVAGKGGASVAGAQTVTVVTNATGQAALSGVTPLTSGGLQISVNATFNGLSATASISQSVVTTAAAATGAAGGAAGAAGSTAAATGSAAGAAGAAGGAAGAAGAATGGLSIATVAGIVGGAAAVGGGVVASGGSDSSSGGSGGSGGTGGVDPTGGSGPPPVGLLPSCEFVVSPDDILVGNEGATIPLTITMKNVDPCYDPSWVADAGSAASWISVSPRSGSRSGSTIVTVAPYSPTASAPNRVATIIVAYEKVLISQPCRCPISGLRPR